MDLSTGKVVRVVVKRFLNVGWAQGVVETAVQAVGFGTAGGSGGP